MASSISSECVFSLAEVTISKCRNRVKPDIVEALQFLKCLHCQELICREEPSMILELQMEMPVQELVKGTEVSEKHENWDDIV